MVSLWWVTCPSGKEKEWSHSLGDLPRGKKWPHCNGWPTQVKKMENGLILMGDLPRKYGLIVMGDLPRKGRVVSFLWVTYPGEEWPHSYGWPTQINKKWRMVSFLWVTYPEKYGLIVMGDLPEEKGRVVSFFGWPSQGEKMWWSGLVVMGDLPK